MKIFCLFVILGALSCAIFLSAPVDIFLDRSALIMVFGSVYMAIAFRHGWKSLFNLKFHTSVWIKNGAQEYELLRTIGYTAVISGALHSLIGGVIFYGNFNGWLEGGRGPGPELTLIGLFYGLIIFLISLILTYVGREE